MRPASEVSTSDKINYVINNFATPEVYNFIKASVLEEFREQFGILMSQVSFEATRRLDLLSAMSVSTHQSMREDRVRTAQILQNPQLPSSISPETYFLYSGTLDLNLFHQIQYFSATLQDTMPEDTAKSEYKTALAKFAEDRADNKDLYDFLARNERTLNFLYHTSEWLKSTSNNALIKESELMRNIAKASDITTPNKAMRLSSFKKVQDDAKLPQPSSAGSSQSQ